MVIVPGGADGQVPVDEPGATEGLAVVSASVPAPITISTFASVSPGESHELPKVRLHRGFKEPLAIDPVASQAGGPRAAVR